MINLKQTVMNENLDLTKILKDCPEGTAFWSDDYGKVEFLCIDTSLQHPIRTIRTDGNSSSYTKEGWCNINFPASCLLWPSKDCRDWSKFTAPWYKKDKYDPKTLKPLDIVIVRSDDKGTWFCDSFSYVYPDSICVCTGGCEYKQCVPYNDETKHLVGTTDEAPEFYKYWEE